MCWRKRCAPLALLLAAAASAAEGYILGAGLEGDSADGFAASVIGSLGLTEKTWLSGALARNSADLELRDDLVTRFADISIDHSWDPVGIRAGLSYWGDEDSLESTDWRASLYWSEDRFSIAGDYEQREFDFNTSTFDRFPDRRRGFTADGVGLSVRFNVSDAVSVGVSGMDYDYDVNLRLDSDRGLLQLLAFSRFSLINSLVDYRAAANLGFDAGESRWQFDIGTWKGEVDGSTTRSATIRFLNPLGDAADIELSMGFDDSKLYGNVTFFSVFLFFYGGS